MKKNLRVILLSLLGLAVLGGIVLLLELTNFTLSDKFTDEPDTPEVKETSTVFTDFSVNDIVSIRIANQKDDGYTISQNLTNLSIAELDERSQGVPYNEQSLLNAATAAATLSSHSTVEENANDLDKYGLGESPAVKVEASFRGSHGGDAVSFIIGNATPDGSTHYFRLKDDNTVYTILSHTINILFNERHDFIERLAFPQYNSHDAPTVELVTIERSGLDDPIVIEAIPELPLEELRTFNSHRLTGAWNIEADPEKSMNIIYGLFGLVASRVLWVAPDEVDFELNGLDDPQCTVEVTVGGEVLLLSLGNEFQGGVVGISSHAPELLLLFEPQTLPWLSVQPVDLVSDTFLTPYIYSLDIDC